VGAADHEASRRIDEKLRIRIHHLLRQNHIEHMLFDICMDLFLGHGIVMLCRKHDSVKAERLAVLIVLHRHLRLSVGTKIRKRLILADFRQPSRQLVSQGDGIRHVLFRLVAGIAEHHALVAGADGV